MSTQSENSLMKKTKKELCEIIFRKDDVEKQLRKELNDLNLDFSKAKDMVAKRDVNISNLEKVNEELSSKLESASVSTNVSNNSIKKLTVARNSFAIAAGVLLVAVIILAIF